MQIYIYIHIYIHNQLRTFKNVYIGQCFTKKTHQERTFVNSRIESWGCPPGSNLNKGKGWPAECDYSSTLREEVMCYVTEKPMPSPTSLPIVWPSLYSPFSWVFCFWGQLKSALKGIFFQSDVISSTIW